MSDAKQEPRFEFELWRGWTSHKTRFRVIAEGPVDVNDLRRLITLLTVQADVLRDTDTGAATEKVAPAPAPPEEPIPAA